MQLIILDAGANRYHTARTHRLNPVQDGILDERLKKKGWDQCTSSGWHDVTLISEPLAKPYLHDCEIALDEVSLAFQWHELLRRGIQCQPKHIAQGGNHSISFLRIFVHEFGDNVQGIEEEMRLKLALQYVKAGTGETGSPLLFAAEEERGVRSTHDHEVDGQPESDQVK